MKQTTILIAGLSLATTSLMAGPVDRSQATALAREFLASKGIYMAEPQESMHAPRRDDNGGSCPYYIFNAGDDQGYVIISGDDRTESVLGYATQGSMAADNLPDNLRSWLQYYTDRINSLSQDDALVQQPAMRPVRMAPHVAEPYHAISPILTTRWDQGSPYNQQCPNYTISGITDKCATGCVATAVAQVMYHYQWPAATTAKIPTYIATTKPESPYSVNTTMLFIPAGTKIEWSEMLTRYNSSSPAEAGNAVATLMKMIGQSTLMNYGPESGSNYEQALPGLKTYFGYDHRAYNAYRENYTIDGWFNLIYSELDKGRPVLFSGQSSGGGHAFVLDGFDGSEYFHVNWGWGGQMDGYFLVDVLNPDDNSGIGASSTTDGYSMSQNIIANLAPEGQAEEVDAPSPNFAEFGLNSVSGSDVNISFLSRMLGKNDFEVGLAMPSSNGKLQFLTSGQVSLECNWGYSSINFTVPTNNLSVGTYRLTPAARIKGTEEFCTLFDLETEWIEAKVTLVSVMKKELTLTLHTRDANVSAVGDWRFPYAISTGLEVGINQRCNVTLGNTGSEEYYGTVYFFAYYSTKGSPYLKTQVALKPGQQREYSFTFLAQSTGKLNLLLARDPKGTDVISQTSCTIVNKQPLPTIYLDKIVSTNNALGNYLEGYATVHNTGDKDYNSQLTLKLWKDIGNSMATSVTEQVLQANIKPGESIDLPFKFEEMEVGVLYFITVHYTREMTSSDRAYVDNCKLGWYRWTIQAGMMGDINNDGAVNVADLIRGTAILLNKEDKPSNILPLDYNHDGDFKEADLEIMRSTLLDKE